MTTNTTNSLQPVLKIASTDRASQTVLPIRRPDVLRGSRHEGILLELLLHHFDHDLEAKRIAIWGGSAHNETIALANHLARLGADVVCHGMNCSNQLQHQRVTFENDKHKAIHHADALIIMTSATEYVGIASDPGLLKWQMNDDVVFDVAGGLDQQSLSYGSTVYYDATIQDRKQEFAAAMA